MSATTTGLRIATYCRRRGLGQALLAGLVGALRVLVVAGGADVRSADRLSVLIDMAKGLQVEMKALVGRPWRYAPSGSALVDDLSEVRLALAR